MICQDVAEQVCLGHKTHLNAFANCADLANTWSATDVHLYLPNEHLTHHFSHLDLVE